jgi:hypothetical protein
MKGTTRTSPPSHCQRGGCDNPGPLYLFEHWGFDADTARHVDAGYRWYCGDCNDKLVAAVMAKATVISTQPMKRVDGVMVPAGPKTFASAGTETRQ